MQIMIVFLPLFLKVTKLSLRNFTSSEIESYISQFDNNNSTGPHSITGSLLKILKSHIAPLVFFYK